MQTHLHWRTRWSVGRIGPVEKWGLILSENECVNIKCVGHWLDENLNYVTFLWCYLSHCRSIDEPITCARVCDVDEHLITMASVISLSQKRCKLPKMAKVSTWLSRIKVVIRNRNTWSYDCFEQLYAVWYFWFRCELPMRLHFTD